MSSITTEKLRYYTSEASEGFVTYGTIVLGSAADHDLSYRIIRSDSALISATLTLPQSVLG